MCDCESPDYDEESGEELWEDNEVVAVLPFSCCECHHPIKSGTTYRHIKGCWDGDWSTYRMCLDCSAVSDRFREKGGCHCFGGLYEELIDSEILCWDEESENWIEQESWLEVVCHHLLKCEVVNEFVAIAHEWLKGLDVIDGEVCHEITIQKTEIKSAEEDRQTLEIEVDFSFGSRKTWAVYKFVVVRDPFTHEYKIFAWDTIEVEEHSPEIETTAEDIPF